MTLHDTKLYYEFIKVSLLSGFNREKIDNQNDSFTPEVIYRNQKNKPYHSHYRTNNI